MKIGKMISKVKMHYIIFSTHSLKKCLEVSLENLYVAIEA